MTVLPESSKDGKVRALSEFENQNYFFNFVEIEIPQYFILPVGP